MGGCRCSYRDCSVRSDGKTHMFHFPVFDKIRCHQWIENAQRTEFLNLKISQLKNRVACQHHFKDEMFMNETKGRLKQDAVPTEDGPYCSTKIETVQEKALPINIDDIENDYLSYREKQAHMGVKYGDFLTNDVEIKDLQNQGTHTIIIERFDKYDATIDYNINNLLQNSKIKLKNIDVSPSKDLNMYKYKLRSKPEKLAIKFEELIKPTINSDQNVTPKPEKRSIQFEELIKPTINSDPNVTQKPEKRAIQFEELIKPTINSDQNVTLEPNTQLTDIQNTQKSDPNMSKDLTNMEQKKGNSASRKIKILSHKTITCPVKKEGKIEPEAIIQNADLQNTQKSDQNISADLTNMEQKNVNSDSRKIRILSHKTITGPVKIEGKLEPVSATALINVPKKNKLSNDQVSMNPGGGILIPSIVNPKTEIPLQTSFEFKQPNESGNQPLLFTNTQCNNETIFQSFNLEKELLQNAVDVPTEQHNVQKNIEYPLFQSIQNEPPVSTSQEIVTKLSETEKTPTIRSLLKAKLPPEKQAKIEEKRKYNMKVTDILDSCFKKCDDDLPNFDISKILEDKQKVKDKNSPSTQTSSSNLKTPKKNSFAYIEEQLQKMESNLLSKIEENTQRIVQLKRAVKPEMTRRTISTQTKEISEEAHKKQLYVEISKFLTPEANSLIFEELFINQYTEPSQKKRKVR